MLKKPSFYINVFLSAVVVVSIISIFNLPGNAFVRRAMATVGAITGDGTVNLLSRFVGASGTVNTIGNSIIYDNGTNVGIGTTNPNLGILDVRAAASRINIYSTTETNPAYTRIQNGSGTMNVGLEGSAVSLMLGDTAYAGVINVQQAYPLQFGTDNTVRMTILPTTGNVGIGTTSPGYKLTILGDGVNFRSQAVTGTGYAAGSFGNAVSDLIFGTNSHTGTLLTGGLADSGVISTDNTTALQFGTNNTANMTILSGGNVGIGTTGPGSKLMVNDDGTLTTYMRLVDIRQGSGDHITMGMSPTTNYITTGGNPLAFATNTGATGSAIPTNVAMTILANGNVGIGTAAPGVKLEVNGSIRGNQSGAVRIDTGYGYVDIGPQNTSWAHFLTDRPNFYFSPGVQVDGTLGAYGGGWSATKAGTITAAQFVGGGAGITGITATSIPWSGITSVPTTVYTSAARPGPTRLYRSDDNSDYNLQTNWNTPWAGYWGLRGYSGGTFHADVAVGYAASAGTAGSAPANGGTATNFNNGTSYSSGGEVHATSFYIGGGTYGLFNTSAYIDTLNTGSAGDNIEVGYYRAGDLNLFGSDLTAVNNHYIYPARHDTTTVQKSWWLGSDSTYGLYSNTGLNAAGGLWDAGNRVYSAGNPQVNISGNAAYATTAGTVTNGVTTNGGQNFTSGPYSSDWFRSTGNDGWYNSTYAVGVYATQAGRVDIYNGAGLYVPGSVGIGVAPDAKLDVNGNAYVRGMLALDSIQGYHTGNVAFTNGGNTSFTGTVSFASTTTFGAGVATAAGDIGVARVESPTEGVIYLGNSAARYLYYNGTGYYLNGADLYVNNVYNASDARLKKNITDSNLGLDFINKLRPVSFNWIQGDNKEHYGMLAQEVNAVVSPDAGFVNTNSDTGYYSMNYPEFIGPIIKGMQQLDSKVSSQQKQIDELKVENTSLESRLSALEQKIK